MTELRRFSLIACLVVVASVALYRAVGSKAEPIAGIALYALALSAWRARKRRLNEVRRAVIELRQYEAADRRAIVAGLEADDFRSSVERELEREGTETSDGLTEVFPLPAGFRRRATLQYWWSWAYSVAALLVAALLPELNPQWRGVWLGLGLVLGYRAWRKTRLRVLAESVVEVNPFRIAYVQPDGVRLSISFAQGAHCEDVPEDRMFVVRSGNMMVPVSYSLVGFNRIAQLVEDYGAVVPKPMPPAS
jgi:hypothetical protein